MVMKRNMYFEVGGFDENCFMYSDDIDLSYMVLKTGRSNYYFHETTVIHYKGESTVRDGMYMKRFREAMQFFYKKHFGGSFVFNAFMRLGAFFFALFKKKQQKQVARAIDEYVLVSKNVDLTSALEIKLQKNVTQLTEISRNALFSREISMGKQLEVVLDNNSYPFREIIVFLEENKNKGLTFKIIPEETSFAIGSNSSNDRGEIVIVE